MIRFSCPTCSTILQATEATKVRCCRCGQKLLVPSPPVAGRDKTVLGKLEPEPQASGFRAAKLPPPLPPPLPPMMARLLERNPAHPARPETAGQICCTLSLIFGLLSLFVCGLPFGVAGLVLGIVGINLSREKRRMGKWGAVLSTIGLIAAAIILMNWLERGGNWGRQDTWYYEWRYYRY
jgi:hypothetical protein